MDVEVIVKTESTETAMVSAEVQNVEIQNESVEAVPTTTKRPSAYALLYVCSICMKVFKDKNKFDLHLQIVHRPLSINILSGAFCDLCRKVLHENVFDSHLPQCLSNFNSLPAPTNQKNTKNFQCQICFHAFTNLNRLSEHLRNVHRPITINYDGKSDHSFCDTCKNLFKDDLFTHFPCSAVDVKCFFCLINMPLQGHFITHNLFALGFRKFQCSICTVDTKMMNFKEVNEHMKQHNGLGIFQCIKCNLHMDQSELEKHYEMYHQGCKCPADPCTCDKYNEHFYIKNILKIDVPSENLKSAVDTQNKSIQTSTTVQIPKVKIARKNSVPPKLPEKTPCAKKEDKSKNLSKTLEKENSTLHDTPVPTMEELLQKKFIDKESFLRTYFKTSVAKNFGIPQKIYPNKRLTKHQLKIYRGLIAKQGQMRAREKYEQANAQLKLLENSKTEKNEQNATVLKERYEIICSDIVKEEQIEYMDSGNIKNEIDPLLEDIVPENSQQPVDFKNTSVQPMLSDNSEESQKEENDNKRLKLQS